MLMFLVTLNLSGLIFLNTLLFFYFFINKIEMYLEFNLMNFYSYKMELLILLDWMSLLFSSVVMFISLMVLIYSIEYIGLDLKFNQFIYLILLFILSMILMIFSPNIISILVGWDGLGLISYCLVLFYQSKNSFNSGMVTVLMNRIGDVMILISIGLFLSVGSWNFSFSLNLENLIMILLMIAGFTKSAQLPFSAWLPMAMAAPTPVSSLVHSSTLVTAGVYLMIRINYLMTDLSMIYMMLISVMTMFLSGLGANFEFDLKKIIALSTLSQLGVMFFSLSMKMVEVTIFHLLTHAMFKSLLFMCAGVIIHNMLGNQDIRCISSVLINLPLISVMFNCSTFSLCGIPFMSGFFSKDMILEMFMMSIFNKLIFLLVFISMGLTLMYSIRLMYYSFIKEPQLIFYNKFISMKSLMVKSMFMLFIFSVLLGILLSWLLFSFKNKVFLLLFYKLMIYIFMLLGLLISLIYIKMYNKVYVIKMFNSIMEFLKKLWFMSTKLVIIIWKFFNFGMSLYFLFELDLLAYILSVLFNYLVTMFFSSEFFKKNYFYIIPMLLIMIIMIYFTFFS